MNNWLVVSGVIGIMCTVASLIGMTIALTREGKWGMVLCCLAALALILFLTLVGIEYADGFWKGRS